MNTPTFRLLPSLQFTPHISSGRRWYAVEDPQSGRFIKLGTAEYLVASGLQNGVAPAQIVQVLDQNGFDNAKDRVTSTISWLAKQGLLLNEAATGPNATPGASPDADAHAPESSPNSGAARPAKPLAPLSFHFDPFFIRLPLLPGAMAERIARPFAFLISWLGGAAFTILMLVAGSFLLTSSERFWSLNEKLFVEDGRLWWLAAWFVLKCCHEMGHAVAAVSTGSRIRSAGLHFIFMAPVPYVDVTDLWRVTNGRQRVLVSAAGMLAEMTVAAVAVLVALASHNLQVQYMCAALATLGTITTIAFNGNPLMKFDGYYILSDYLSRPNLWTEAQSAAGNVVKRVLNPFAARIGLVQSASGLNTQGAQMGLAAFGLTTMFYRVLMLATMAWWLLTVWHGVGALVIAWAVWGWFVRPFWMKRANMRAAVAAGLMPPEALVGSLAKRRAQWVYMAAVSVVIAMIGLLPSPRSVRAPGVVGYGDPMTVRADAEGVLIEVLVSDRQMIAAGQVIARLENPQLLVELADTRLKYQASLEQANALRARGELAMLQAEQAKMESLAAHVEQMTNRANNLEVRAPCAGMLLMNLAEKTQGRFIKQGMPLCMIVAPDTLEVVASASQRDVSLFSQHQGEPVTVAATGSRGCVGKLVSVDTRGSGHCELQALAARYGGPLPVEFSSNEKGEPELRFPGPRFEIKADLTEASEKHWLPGQMVWIHLHQSPQRVWQWVWSGVTDGWE